VARLGDDVTVKRFRRTRGAIELIPENPDFETIVVPTTGEASDGLFAIEGLAVGLVRNNMTL
jgi:repressor LexA